MAADDWGKWLSNQRMKLTGAAILASRGMEFSQAAPATYPYRSAACGMAVPFLHQPGDDIALLDLTARCAFASASSISFDLGRCSPGLFQQLGWLDVHHPCNDNYVKTRLRVRLPAEYERLDCVKRLADEVFAALAIPAGEVYELSFSSEGRQVRFTNREDFIGGTLREP